MESVSSIVSSCPMSGSTLWDPGGNTHRYSKPSIHHIMRRLTLGNNDRLWGNNIVRSGEVKINPYLARRIHELSSVHHDDDNDTSDDVENAGMSSEDEIKCELDTHANMAVVGSEIYVIEETGETACVQPYCPDYESREIPVVHAGVLYQCPYTGMEYILIIRNALLVPSMKVNLIPPEVIFILLVYLVGMFNGCGNFYPILMGCLPYPFLHS